MRHNLLFTAMMMTFALATVACEKKEDCLSDPACLAQARAISGPQLFPLAQQAAVNNQVPGALPPNTQPFRISSVANAAIKAQSMKVQAAIKADDENPESTYYKAPMPELPAVYNAETGARVPSSVASSSSPAPEASSGEAAR